MEMSQKEPPPASEELSARTSAPSTGGRHASIQLSSAAKAQPTAPRSAKLWAALTPVFTIGLGIYALANDIPSPALYILVLFGCLPAVIISIARNDWMSLAVAIVLNVISIPLAMLAVLFYAIFLTPFSAGRPFRRGRKVVTAQAAFGEDWLPAVLPPVQDVDGATRQALGQLWLRDALAEHASIAAFSRLSLELLAAGAPPHLVEGAHQAALDEVRHARICFALASAYSGQSHAPGPFADATARRLFPTQRALQLSLLARESLVDGCLGEGVSAALLSQGAEQAAAPALKELLRAMAADEERHAQLAWDILAFCLASGGAPVQRAVAETLAALPASPPPSAASADPAWAVHGRATPHQEQTQYMRLARQVHDRIQGGRAEPPRQRPLFSLFTG